MGKLSNFGTNPTLREYMQGAARQAISPFQEFVAPTVPVPSMTGKIKRWDEKSPLIIPSTRRGLTGKAAIIDFGVNDTNFELSANSLDCPVDKILIEDEGVMDVLKEAADITAQVSSLASHKETIDLALAAVGAGTNKNVNAAGIDLVDEVDAQIGQVILGTKGFAPLMVIRILWGFTAWRRFKNHASVRDRFKSNSKKDATNIGLADVASLFCVPVEQKLSTVVIDENVNKDAVSAKFLLDDSLLVFACCPSPTRYDTSFMKTLRKRGAYMAPRFYERDDKRVEVAGFDWNEQILAANAAAAKRLNWTEA